MRRWRLLLVGVLALSSLGATVKSTCYPVRGAAACSQSNWITAGTTRVSGGGWGVSLGRVGVEADGPSWSARPPGPFDAGSWAGSGVAGTGTTLTPHPNADLVGVSGPFRGVLDTVVVTLFARTATWPAPQSLRLRVLVDGVGIADRTAKPITVQPRSPVVNGVQTMSFAVTGIDAALHRAGIRNGARARHHVSLAFGPGKADQHVYLWGTFEAPSRVDFNARPASDGSVTIVRAR